MLQTTGIDHLNLQVKDLKESLSFYKSLFGFTLLKKEPDHKGAIIGNDNSKLCLYEDSGMANYEKRGFSHFGMNVSNFEEVITLCNELDIPVYYNGIVDWGKSRSVYIKDPSGYEIEITEVWGGGLA